MRVTDFNHMIDLLSFVVCEIGLIDELLQKFTNK